MNDATIIHKTNFQLKGHVVSGIIEQLDFADLSRDDDNGNNEFSLLDGILISAGILECKTEKYSTNQTFLEMLRTGGDLVAKVLTEGGKVDRAILYGLAFNFNTKDAVLTILNLDFLKETALAMLSSEPIDVHSAMNWLLNCINLSEDELAP